MPDKQLKPVYVLHGNDAFLRDAARDELVRQIIGDSDPQVAVTVFDADAELAGVLDTLRTVPFLAPRRAVVVRDADAFVARYREIDVPDAKRGQPKTRRPLDEYIQSPAAHSCLILMVNSWPSNTAIAKTVATAGEAVDCNSPDTDSPMMTRKLAEFASKRGKKIEPEAGRLLANWAGWSLANLETEVEKLSLYVGDRAAITADDVSKLAIAAADPAAFALTNAITALDPAAALRALGEVLVRRGDEFQILGQIGWHLRRALGAQRNIQAGMTPQKALPKMPYDVQAKFQAYLNRRPLPKLQQDFRRLIAADLAMKSGTDAASAMTQLVVQLCI